MIQWKNILLAILMGLSATTFAAPPEDKGPYFGLGFGIGMINQQPHLDNFTTDVRAMTWAPTNVIVTSETQDSVGKVFVGWRFGPRVSVEAVFFRGGDYSMAATVNDPAVVDEVTPANSIEAKTGRMTLSASIQGVGYQVLVFSPNWKQANLFGKFGGAMVTTTYECVQSGHFTTNNECPSNGGAGRSQLLYGVGATWNLPNYIFRLDIDRVESVYLPTKTSKNDLTMATLNVVLKF